MYIIDKEKCVCCHNCATECPGVAIDFVNKKYEIDQDKCVECGICEKVCHSGACEKVPDFEPIIKQHDKIIKECDLVVVGSGSGLVTAVKAAQAGKKVIVLEKGRKIGGNTDYAHGYMPQYTKLHQKYGFKDLREEAISHFMEVSKNEIEEELIRAAVYGAGEFFDWLCTICDVEQVYELKRLEDGDFHGPIYGDASLEFKGRWKVNLNCRDDAIGPGWGGTHVIHTMLDTMEREKLDIKILTSTAAEHLILDSEGKICGVMAKDPGGDVQINCKAVMLACGGFGRNDEYLKKYCHVDFFSGTPIHRFSVPTDTGDAITMLGELGIKPDPERMFVSIFGPRHHPFNNSIADLAMEGEFPQVNLNGKRWFDESEAIFHGVEKIYQQPDHVSYTIMPYAQVRDLAKRFINTSAFGSRAKFFETWEADLDHESTLDIPVKKADTLFELAKKMNVDEQVFLDEMKRYREFTLKGVDEDFHKDASMLKEFPLDEGPYYAVYGQCFSEAAMGGVTVNANSQVLNNDGDVIPGLYAGGDCTSAMHRKGKLAPISELTWAVASGYTAGKQIADYIDNTGR